MNNHTLLISYKTSSAAELNAAVMSYDHSFDIFHQRQSQVFLIHLYYMILHQKVWVNTPFLPTSVHH